MTAPLNTTKLSNQAFEAGREHGRSAGSWVFDGNTDRATYERVLTGYENGDPEIMDMEPAPLSGEWADGPTPQTLADDLGLSEEQRGSELDQLCTDYELGFGEGFWAEVCESARYQLAD